MSLQPPPWPEPAEEIIKAVLTMYAGRRPIHLAVRDLPTSGIPAELMDAAGIGVQAIVEAVRSAMGHD